MSVTISVFAVTPTWYQDLDGDGFGNPNVISNAPNCPPGYVSNNLDCDDNRFHQTIWQQQGGIVSSGSLSIKQVFGPNGTPYVLSRSNDNTPGAEHKLSVLTFNGASWQLVGSADFSSAIANQFIRPDIVVDNNGIPYVSYFYDNGSPGFYDLYVMKYTGAGPTGWELVGTSGFARISDNIKQSVPLAINSSNEVFIAFPDGDNNDAPTVMKYTGAGPTGWELVGSSLTVNKTFYLSFAIDGNDNLYVGFQDASDDGFGNLGKATVMTFDGINWTPVGSPTFSAGTGGIASNQVTVSPGNVPYFIYWDTDGSGNDMIEVKKFDSTVSGWVDVGNTSPVYAGTFTTDVDKNLLSMVFDPAGIPYISYVDNSLNMVVMKLDNNNNWTVVGSVFPTDVYPSLSIGPDKVPYLSYVNSTYDAYVVKTVAEVINPDIAVISTTSTVICLGSVVTLSITASNLNGADKWEWYSGSCGGTALGTGTGTSLIISPTVTTTYFVRGEGVCLSSPGTCSGITITVNSAPSVTSQPANTTVCGSGTAIFNASATGTSLAYQWQTDNGTSGSVWNNIVGSTITGLTLSGVNASMNGYHYRLSITGVCAPSVTTSGALLTVNTIPVIATQPSGITTCAGSAITYIVSATGTGLSYQWEQDNGSGYTSISGANTSVLGISASSSLSGTNYRVIISGGGVCGTSTLTSNGANLVVNTIPVIATQPSGITTCSGSAITYVVSATGTGLSYQWQSDGGTGTYSSISGANTSVLGISASGSLSGTNYRVIISGGGVCGTSTLTSNGANLVVNTIPVIATQPVGITTCAGSAITYIVSATGTGLSYQWQSDGGTGTYSSISGANTSVLGISALSSLSGTNYRVVISGGGVCGTSTLTSNGANLVVNTIPVIATQPVGITTCAGSAITYVVSATGTGLTYQWQIDGGTGTYSSISGANTSVLGISASGSLSGTNYRVVISGGGVCGTSTLTSNGANLVVNTIPVIATQPVGITTCAGSAITYIVSATGTGLSYQWQSDGGTGTYSSISGANTSVLGVIASSSLSGTNYRVIISGGGVCGTSTLTSNGANLVVNTIPVIATQPSGITTCAGSAITYIVSATGTGLTYQWQSDGGTGTYGSISGANTFVLGVSASSSLSGTNYRVIISGGGVCGTSTLTSNGANLVVNTIPVIATQPAGITTCAGSAITYVVSATGTNLAYQWEQDNGSGYSSISGANTSVLGISALSSLSGTNYRVVISGGGVCGTSTITSNGANLVVNTIPVIATQPSGITTCAGSAITYIVSATGTGLTYQWQSDGGTGTYSSISGANTSVLGVSASSSLSGTNYRVVISGGGVCGTSTLTSNGANLVVNTIPVIATQPVGITTCAGSAITYVVSATGTNLAYQWEQDNGSGYSSISGANTSVLGVIASSSLSGTNYRVIISGGGVCGTSTLTSNGANLVVNTIPVIATQPSGITTCAGSAITYIVSATGTGLTYQWQSDGGTGTYSSISGANTSVLGVSASSSLSGTNYRVIISGGGVCGTSTLTSNGANLVVNTIPVIATQPVGITTCAGSAITYVVSATGTGLTYQWQSDGGTGTYSSISGANTSVLGVSASSSLSGTNYRVIISGGGVCGTSTLTSNGTNLVVNTIPVIATQPSGITTCAGSAITYIVSATGTNLAYQWELDNGSGYSSISGANTSVLGVSASSSLSGTNYRVVISGGGVCGTSSLASNGANLVVNTIPVIATQPSGITTCAGSAITYIVSATGTGLSYQWEQDNGSGYTSISGANTSVLGVIGSSSLSGTNYRVVISGGGVCGTSTITSNGANLVVNTIPVIATQPSGITTCAGSAITYIVSATGTNLAYQWEQDNGSGYSSISGANTFVLGVIASSSLSGTNYRVVISGGGVCGTSTLTSNGANLVVNTIPVIATQPVGITTCAGSAITYVVSATSTNLAYQWEQDNGSGYSSISGANTSVLGVSASSSLSGTNYRVIISGGGVCGTSTITSNGANLVVNTIPVIATQPVDITSCLGTNVTYTVSATGTNLAYQWQSDNGTGTFGNIVNATISGLGLSNITTAMSGYKYKVIVSNTGCIPIASDGLATLYVNVPPAIIKQPSDTIQCVGGNVNYTVSATGATLSYQWQINNGSGYTDINGSTSTGLNLNNIALSANGTIYRVVVNGLCSPSVTSSGALLTVNAPPQIVTQPSAIVQQCEFANAIYSVSVTGSSLTYQWKVNSGSGWNDVPQGTSNTLTLMGITSLMNNNLYLAIINSGTCYSIKSDSSLLEIQSLPVVSAGPDKTVNKGESTVLEGSAITNNPQYQWSPVTGLGNASALQPSASPLSDTYYTLTVIDGNGCSASDTVFVKVVKDVLKIPNAFSPNGDGVHDKWVIQNLSVYTNCSIQVFNRYGDSVYSSNGYAEWDGTANGQLLPVGTYYYIIDLKDGTTYTGYVVIL